MDLIEVCFQQKTKLIRSGTFLLRNRESAEDVFSALLLSIMNKKIECENPVAYMTGRYYMMCRNLKQMSGTDQNKYFLTVRNKNTSEIIPNIACTDYDDTLDRFDESFKKHTSKLTSRELECFLAFLLDDRPIGQQQKDFTIGKYNTVKTQYTIAKNKLKILMKEDLCR